MNKTFVEEIRNAVAVALEDKIVEVKEMEKGNGVVYTGITIRTEGNNIAPNIYINEDLSVEDNVENISEQLFKDAIESAKAVAPAERKSMFETLKGMGVSADPMMDVPMPFTMDVLRNTFKIYGASAILYTDVTENTYMIPSSIHEVILINGDMVDEMNLNQMIKEVNATQVEPEERLSNHAYRFNGTNWENVA